MAYSAGFSPHPKISYAGAAPTGTASEAEYLEIGVVERCDPARLAAALDEALPPGLDVLEVVEARSPGLPDRLEGSVWQVRLPGVSRDEAGAAVEAFMARPVVLVERLTKSGRRELDARSAVVRLTVDESASSDEGRDTQDRCAILRLVVRHATPAVRPDDVLAGLRQVASLAPPVPPAVTRLAQGLLDEPTGTVADPLAADRVAASDADEGSPGAAGDGTAPGPDPDVAGATTSS